MVLPFPLQKIDPFLEGKDNVKRLDTSTLTLRKEDLPRKPEVFVLRYD